MGVQNYKKRQKLEVEKNYEVYKKLVLKDSDALQKFYGYYALMKDGKIINYYTTLGEADAAGSLAYKDDIYSIQEVTFRGILFL